ncbi:activator-dependent family glycosyltransferase [Microtetraspora niveoalba]|uniref:activator-dependent family glycosyltransferase n=1 Tax=Microtetraspora niveoalba TaxID=46175 RepID=UPI0008369489|nr:activator-dependent family glycosyltransferase [Microtetraspora niveoalba]
MRVLFVTYAEKTHYHMMVPLAWAMQTAGHEVRVASQVELAETITGSGLAAVPVGTSDFHRIAEQAGEGGIQFTDPVTDLAETDPEKLTWESMLGSYTVRVPQYFAIANSLSMLTDLVAYARYWRPDLVVWEPFSFSGAVAARLTGAAHARLLWMPDVLGVRRARFRDLLARQEPDLRDDPLAEWLTWAMELFGGEFDEELTTGAFDIDIVPPAFRLPAYDRRPVVNTRYVPYNGPALLPDWLLAPSEKTRVCLSMGITSSQTGAFPVSFGEVLEATADLDVEMVATVPERLQEELRTVPGNVRLSGFVPLNPLLQQCSAIVHHGGAGTQWTAVLNGVPQLMLPWQFDSVLKARMLREVGAGLAVERHELTAEGLRTDLERLLKEPSFAEAATRLRDQTLATPSPNEVVPLLEKLATEHRR